MKRYGLRLAAGLAVASLGALGIYQTQHDGASAEKAPWPELDPISGDGGPAPLPAVGDYPAPPDLQPRPPVVRGNDGDSASEQMATNFSEGNQASGYPTASQPPSGIRQASFDSPVDPAEEEDTPAAAELPNDSPRPSTGGQLLPPPMASPERGEETQPAAALGSPQGETGQPFAPPPLGAPTTAPPPAGESSRPAGESSRPAAPSRSPGLGLPPLSDPATQPNDSTESAASPVPAASAEDAAGGYRAAASDGPGMNDSIAAGSDLRLRSGNPPAVADPVDAAATNWGSGSRTSGNPAAEEVGAASPPQETEPNGGDENDASGWGQPAAAAADTARSSAPPISSAPAAPAGLDPGPTPHAAAVATPGSPDPNVPTGNGLANQDDVASPTANTPPRRPSDGSGFAGANLQPAAPMSNDAKPTPMATAAIRTVTPDEVLAQPGTRDLEGVQAPHLAVQKIAPTEIRVGRPTEFRLRVQNVGSVAALDVRVFDAVPQGTSLVETVPPAKPNGEMLTWQLGDLRAGEERVVVVKVLPEVEGEIGSVARVTFETAASVRTVATQPKLELTQNVPPQVLIGQQLEIDIALANRGSGAARGVVLMSDIPEGLEHVSGRQIELPIGELPPGSQRREMLRLRATQPGVIQNTIILTDADGVETRSTVDIEVISPAVELALDGPSLRYLERQATYELQVANRGTADASNIEIAAFLDQGLKFVSTEANGQYDPQRHAVFWSLAELPAGKDAAVPLTVLPVEAGTQAVRLEANADLGLTAVNTKELTIDTLAELSFTIADEHDPIEVGSDTVYEIQVRNTGTRNDSNVRLEVMLPHPALELVTADPAARTDGQGLVVFEPLASLPAKGEQTYRIRVRGSSADTHLIKARLVSDQSKRPVTKEESTTVYSDQ